MLSIHCLEVTVEAITPLALDPYCGSAFRGAFFRSIWGRFCTNREAPTCEECPLLSACPVASLVAPLREESPRGRNMPRPYIIVPPYKESGRYERGERLTFGFTLIGNAAKLYPYVIRTFQEMEQNNIGHPLHELNERRGKICLQAISAFHPITGEKRLLWQRGEKRPEVPRLSVTSDDIAVRADQLPRDHITIHFVSPTRLKADERVQRRPTFSTLVARLAQRLEQIQQEYGDGVVDERIVPDKAWYLSLKEKAAHICTEQDETTWVEVSSYSTRQKQVMPIGGIIGKVSFAGDLKPFLELLVWGEILRVGKNIVKGGGAYRLEW
jgi:hypothetical protein